MIGCPVGSVQRSIRLHLIQSARVWLPNSHTLSAPFRSFWSLRLGCLRLLAATFLASQDDTALGGNPRRAWREMAPSDDKKHAWGLELGLPPPFLHSPASTALVRPPFSLLGASLSPMFCTFAKTFLVLQCFGWYTSPYPSSLPLFHTMRFYFSRDFLVRVCHGTLVDLCISDANLAFLLVDQVVSCLALHPKHDCVHSTNDDAFLW